MTQNETTHDETTHDETTHDETDHRNQITEAAAVIADWPTLWTQLLLVHVPRRHDKRCAGCATDARLTPRWPCRVAELAWAARGFYLARALTTQALKN